MADRWLFGEVGSDAQLIDSLRRRRPSTPDAPTCSNCSRHLDGRSDCAGPGHRRPVRRRSSCCRRWRARLAAAARVAPIDNDEQLGLLECGPKRSGPLNTPRPAAARRPRPGGRASVAHPSSQADELEARLRQIERQAVEVAASARASWRPRTTNSGARAGHPRRRAAGPRLADRQAAARPAPDRRGARRCVGNDRRCPGRRAPPLADVRAITQGIHPAILDDHGIVAGHRRQRQAAAAGGDGRRRAGARPAAVRPGDRRSGVLRGVRGDGQHREARRSDRGRRWCLSIKGHHLLGLRIARRGRAQRRPRRRQRAHQHGRPGSRARRYGEASRPAPTGGTMVVAALPLTPLLSVAG